jgi:signal-transduction protein with cAMP-binding, CBS, and nucleotidyltransferase domain
MNKGGKFRVTKKEEEAMSTVGHLMNSKPITVGSSTSVKGAAKRMKDDHISSLLVKKGGKIVGIITDSDIVRRGVAGTKDLNKLTVQDIMTSPVATIETVRTTQDAHDMMGDLGVRHLGVTRGGDIIGILSVRDLLVFYKRVSEPKITQD